MATFNEKLRDNYYTNTGDYPRKPVEPAVLSKPAKLLTKAELASIETVKTEHDAALVEYKAGRTRYYERSSELANEFREDLMTEHGTRGHAKESKLYEIAYDMGHSAGFGEIANYYDTLVDLIK